MPHLFLRRYQPKVTHRRSCAGSARGQQNLAFEVDASGLLPYQTLFDLGLSSTPESKTNNDGLELFGVRITNAVKCLPPQNAPTTTEIKNCLPYLIEEIKNLPESCTLLALGKLAHDAVLRSFGLN